MGSPPSAPSEGAELLEPVDARAQHVRERRDVSSNSLQYPQLKLQRRITQLRQEGEKAQSFEHEHRYGRRGRYLSLPRGASHADGASSLKPRAA